MKPPARDGFGTRDREVFAIERRFRLNVNRPNGLADVVRVTGLSFAPTSPRKVVTEGASMTLSKREVLHLNFFPSDCREN